MHRKLKYTATSLVILIVVAALCFLGAIYHLNQYAGLPLNPKATDRKIIVGPGQGVTAVAKMLSHEKIISHPLKFRIYARLNKLDTQIKAGEYLLSGAMAPLEILEKLVRGDVILYRLTIPEGYTVGQVADLVEKTGILTGQEFLTVCQEASLLTRLGIEGQSPEGYLFPDTYFFSKDTTPEKMVETMVNRFWEVFSPAWRKRAETLGWSVYEVITLAAMIEKETGEPKERPVISSVFHNRLKKRMRLASDPTVIYGIKHFDGNVTKKHLATPTPYNTYLIKGLPAGPIANPGQKAIEAALYPADTPYLYFVSKKNGTHHFSSTMQEHNRAVRKYQLRRR